MIIHSCFLFVCICSLCMNFSNSFLCVQTEEHLFLQILFEFIQVSMVLQSQHMKMLYLNAFVPLEMIVMNLCVHGNKGILISWTITFLVPQIDPMKYSNIQPVHHLNQLFIVCQRIEVILEKFMDFYVDCVVVNGENPHYYQVCFTKNALVSANIQLVFQVKF